MPVTPELFVLLLRPSRWRCQGEGVSMRFPCALRLTARQIVSTESALFGFFVQIAEASLITNTALRAILGV